MHDQLIQAIVAEIKPVLVGRTMGRIFQLSRNGIAIDFRTHDNRYLLIDVDPSNPRLHLIERRLRDLEKSSLQLLPFSLVLRKQLGSATLSSITKDENERIVRLSFMARDEIENTRQRVLIAQLTGRAANLLLLDEQSRILDAMRPPKGEGQEVGDSYRPPLAHSLQRSALIPFERGESQTLSEAADHYYQRLADERAFAARLASERSRLRKEIAQREKLRRHLDEDLKAHGDAAEHKRIGDLLLANLTTAERSGGRVVLTDYYAEDAPRFELEIDEQATLQEEAARRFARYAKAKRAAQEITMRLGLLEQELQSLRAEQEQLEGAVAAGDPKALEDFRGKGEKPTASLQPAKRKEAATIPGVRRYLSSDGYEILVGRTARDNDQLTFRHARPHDLWLHAADYPGSHVIVRNSSRAEIPHRTIIEAAQLAAHFSQARLDAKVKVHYTPRKFLTKPKGAAPGLVRLSSFRSLTVEPREAVERINPG